MQASFLLPSLAVPGAVGAQGAINSIDDLLAEYEAFQRFQAAPARKASEEQFFEN